MASVSNGDILKAADRVWGMLDNLAASNPEEYKKFVKQQLDEGKDALAIPEPRFCLRRTDDLVYDVAFHPNVLDECLKDSQLTDMLVGLCLDYVENEVDVYLSDRISCKKVGFKHKGPVEDIRSSIDEDWRHCLPTEVRLDLEPNAIISKIKELKDEAASESLAKLSLISEKSTSNASEKEIAGGTSTDFRETNAESLQLPRDQSSRVLIEELSSTTIKPEGSILTPEHSITVLQEGQLVDIRDACIKPGDMLRVVVDLPTIGGVNDVELEVSESDLELTVLNKYHLLMEFPHRVDDYQTRAKFDTTNSELIITIPCQTRN